MTVGILVDYLKTQSEKGMSHVYLSQDARDAVRSAIQSNKTKAIRSTGEIKERETSLKTQLSTEPSLPAQTSQPNSNPPPPNSREVILPESISISLPEGPKKDQLTALRNVAETWAPAHSLGTLRDRLVFSAGSPDADLMIIGDAPGFDDEMTRTPFTGVAGQKLDKILKAMTLDRESIYLSNICKYRPKSARQTTDNRKPSSHEIAACLPLIKKEIEIVTPKCILVLGATATEALFGESSSDIASLRGTWQEYMNIVTLPSFHPNYLLRNESDVSAKRKLWEDMLLVMERLNVPISDKQRGYFTR